MCSRVHRYELRTKLWNGYHMVKIESEESSTFIAVPRVRSQEAIGIARSYLP